VSAGFLILSADAIRESADSLIVSALRKAGWIACSFSWRILWLSWERESEKIVDIFKPPPPQREAPSTSPMRGSAQLWFSDWSDWSDWSEIQSSD